MGSNSSPSLYIDASCFQGLPTTSIHSIFEGIPGLVLDFSGVEELSKVGRNFFPHVYTVM
jgi:hypothetical protein